MISADRYIIVENGYVICSIGLSLTASGPTLSVNIRCRVSTVKSRYTVRISPCVRILECGQSAGLMGLCTLENRHTDASVTPSATTFEIVADFDEVGFGRVLVAQAPCYIMTDIVDDKVGPISIVGGLPV